MSTFLNAVTEATIVINDYDALSATIGLTAILLLAILLAVKEILRARDADARAMGALDIAIVPLLGAAGLILSQRLLALIA